jgi:hypothetical protein
MTQRLELHLQYFQIYPSDIFKHALGVPFLSFIAPTDTFVTAFVGLGQPLVMHVLGVSRWA